MPKIEIRRYFSVKNAFSRFVTIHLRYRQTTDRKTTLHDNSRTLQCYCNIRL